MFINIEGLSNMPIFINNATELESIQIIIAYDENIVLIEDISTYSGSLSNEG